MKTLCVGGPLHAQEIEVSDKATTFTCSTEGWTYNYTKTITEKPTWNEALKIKFVCEDC